MSLMLQGLDLVANQAGFFFRIPCAGERRLFADFIIGEERFAKASLIMGDEMGGRRQDVTGRAVIAFKPDNGGTGKIGLEPQNIVDLGTTPAID